MSMHKSLLAVVGALALTAAHAADNTPEDLMQTKQRFERQITKTLSLKYLLYLPKGYEAKGDTHWPLMLFLHGAGERGANLSKVAVHGPPKLVKQGKAFPFIIVSPQCPDGESWSNEVLLSLLDDVIARHAVDTNRIYLTGLSMGGFGTWSLAAQHPERFAAIAPICGGGDTIHVLLTSRQKSQALKTLPVWAFHGAKDPVVKVAESERMVAAFKKAGVKEVELTVYPEADHDSWTETYNNEKLYVWFLQHERKAPAK